MSQLPAQYLGRSNFSSTIQFSPSVGGSKIGETHDFKKEIIAQKRTIPGAGMNIRARKTIFHLFRTRRFWFRFWFMVAIAFSVRE